MRNSFLTVVMVIALCLGFQGMSMAADQGTGVSDQGKAVSDQGKAVSDQGKAVSDQGKGASDQGQVSSAEVMKRAEQAVNTAKDYTLEQKQEYEKKVESQYGDLSKRINDLKHQALSAQQGITDRFQGTFDELKKNQEAVEKKLPELRTSTSQAWGEMKDGMDKALTDLRQAYEKARSHFK